jgi:hypothetical protein
MFAFLWAAFWFDTAPIRMIGPDLDEMFQQSSIWRNLPAAVIETPVPMPSLWVGFLFLMIRSGLGHATYLNGHISFSGCWYYFPEALALKSTLAMLLALLVAIAVLVMRRKKPGRSILLLTPGIVYFALSMTSHYQLGIRHLLPILPLLYLFIAMQLTQGPWGQILIGLIILGTIQTAWIHPDYLAYFNLACGGPRSGDRYFIDSNLDWGQDVKRLADWLHTSEIARGRRYSLRIFESNAPDAMQEFGLDPLSLQMPPRGLFAISKNYLHRLEGAKQLPDGTAEPGVDYTWVRQHPLVARIGYSIEVYDLDR